MDTRARMPKPVRNIFVAANVAVLLPMTAAMIGLTSTAPRSRSLSVKNASIQLSNIVPVARKNNHGWCQSVNIGSTSLSRRVCRLRDRKNPLTTVHQPNARRSTSSLFPELTFACSTASCISKIAHYFRRPHVHMVRWLLCPSITQAWNHVGIV